jgi:hypothetical protein
MYLAGQILMVAATIFKETVQDLLQTCWEVPSYFKVSTSLELLEVKLDHLITGLMKLTLWCSCVGKAIRLKQYKWQSVTLLAQDWIRWRMKLWAIITSIVVGLTSLWDFYKNKWEPKELCRYKWGAFQTVQHIETGAGLIFYGWHTLWIIRTGWFNTIILAFFRVGIDNNVRGGFLLWF